MKVIGMIGGGLVMAVGLVFFMQGVGLLPGSFMTGQGFWAVVGAAAVLGGMGLIVWAHRWGRRSGDSTPKGHA